MQRTQVSGTVTGMQLPGEEILSGVVGSQAYGLATEHSDVDTLGVFIAPLTAVVGLHGARVVDTTITAHEPDRAYHELGKFLRLALACNPTVLELLWLPEYEVCTPVGAELVALRRSFLQVRRVRDAYLGYATQQTERLQRRHHEGRDGFSSDTAKRTAKHGRHCMRLILQAEHLLTTGEIRIEMSDAREKIFAAGETAAANPDAFHTWFQTERARIELLPHVLPEHSDSDAINAFLVRARLRDRTPQ